ncbi:hypothetical protein JDV02_004259 [Purpureocillium takamizusanense]|uniref:Uncharacterized protein n=1 Tax=Purpureocillium takamizusanense TaxID=2060973 RepID=A0A9Q8QE48_9HYPO|nr:uncharacterized protein JDV02_004259 [Purpureocillium takamizusanense]UNI17955.1 hypothetical protein JDV02_004259 [Purpureocillium takamizusanense]
MLTSPCFVNIVVVLLRLRWFYRRICEAESRDGEQGSTAPVSEPIVQKAEADLACCAVGRDRSPQGALATKRRDDVGGDEYRALKILLPIVTVYFFGLHLLGGSALAIWARFAQVKYTAYLDELGLNRTWWAFYTTQSLMDNLGFTLTPDAMVSFRDTVFPLLLLTVLALAGETLYPVLLRFAIWAVSRVVPSRLRSPLQFLLDHPRRCYTLLFPAGTTWAILSIAAVLNLGAALLIVVLDLHSAEVAGLAPGNRFVAALFQAAAARHAGTTPYNLANVSPATQFTLLVMMYISVYPVAVGVRAAAEAPYEDRSVGIFGSEPEYGESRGGTYLVRVMREQLSCDLWWIFLGIFLLAVTEGKNVADVNEPAIKIFPIFFEVVSAYCNVGISLGHPSVSSALSTKFSVAGKLVVCAMMIRGRHRGMPYRLDRAVVLPGERERE